LIWSLEKVSKNPYELLEKETSDLLIFMYVYVILNCSKINPNSKNEMKIYPEGRELYLEYHRDVVFKG